MLKLVYVPCVSRTEAENISKVLLQMRLTAHVHILDNIRTLSIQENEVVEEIHAFIMFKTHEVMLEKVVQHIRLLHTLYSPTILSVPVDKENPSYLEWLQETSGVQFQ
ncbi:MAG: divalent cation tolerance protein CutA [Bacteroidia bacterium]|nr:divalent cation tolerance protein CutA [Bacteroidia bacterium]